MKFNKLFTLLTLSLGFSNFNMGAMNNNNIGLNEYLKKGYALLSTGDLVPSKELYDNNDYSVKTVPVWDYLLEKYKNNSNVSELVFVKYLGFADAEVYVYSKNVNDEWKLAKSCKGYVGPKGIGEARHNYNRTPSGDFAISFAFGTDPNPGTRLKYLDLNENLYCCGCSGKYYNKIIDAKVLNHECVEGEHLVDYPNLYDLCFWFEYNKECIFEKGSAFFFHCINETKYTGGCISVEKKDMVDILKCLTEKSRICIFDKEHIVNANTGA